MDGTLMAKEQRSRLRNDVITAGPRGFQPMGDRGLDLLKQKILVEMGWLVGWLTDGERWAALGG